MRKTSMFLAVAVAEYSAVAGPVVSASRNGEDVTVRYAPRVVSTVSSKTASGHAPCKYCATMIKYDRTYRWNAYDHVWEETTPSANVPTVCRKCRQKVRDQERLNTQERELDRKIEYQETKARIRVKKDRLDALRNAD